LSDWYALYIGPSHEPEPHHHFAVQHVIALECPLVVRADSMDGETQAWAVRVESEVPHSITSSGPVALLLTEPREGPSGSSEVGESPRVTTLDRAKPVRDVSAALADGIGVSSADAHAQRISALFASAPEAPRNFDPRVLAALALIEKQGDVGLGRVAAEAGLSQDRFRHLFRDEVGIPFTRFLLWTRIKRAIWLLREGGTLTTALTSAGFADSGHFSKSFKGLFGIPPSLVLQADGIVDCVPGAAVGAPSISGH